MAATTEINSKINPLLEKLKLGADEILSDPLSDQVRRSRKTMLIACAVAIAIGDGNIVPSKIDALGIEFSLIDQTGLLATGLLIVSFLFIAFLVGAVSDLQNSLIKYRTFGGDYKMAKAEVQDWFAKILKRRKRWWDFTYYQRAFWEFGSPILVYGYAVFSLLHAIGKHT